VATRVPILIWFSSTSNVEEEVKTGGLLLGGAGVSGIEVLPPPPPQPAREKIKKVKIKRKNM
jgi:hypothetical protein